MNKITKLAGLALLGTLAISSCKRGEEDPGLSLRSRDSRIEGEWKLSASESQSKESTTVVVGGATTRTFEEQSTVYSNGFNTTTFTNNTTSSDKADTSYVGQPLEMGIELMISKDGTYHEVLTSATEVVTISEVDSSKVTTITKSTVEGDGVWVWGDAGESKSSISFEGTNVLGGNTYVITGLKKDELIFSSSTDESTDVKTSVVIGATTVTSNTKTETTSSSSMTFTQE